MTETEKAKRQIYKGRNTSGQTHFFIIGTIKQHKEDCEDFLEFLRSEYYCRLTEESVWKNDTIRKKQEDLKEAIKIYEKGGF